MKRLITIAAVAASLFAAAQVIAADDYVGLKFSPESWGDEFNKVSASLGGDDRARRTDCKTANDWTVCTFKITRAAYIMIQGKTPTGPAKTAWIIGQVNDAMQSAQLILYWSIFIKTVEPGFKPSDVGDLVNELISDLKDADSEPQQAETEKTKFSLAKLTGIGISLTAEAKKR